MTTIQAAIAESASTDTIIRIRVTAEQRAELLVRCEDCHVDGSTVDVWGFHFSTTFVEAWGTDENGRAWRVIGVHVD
jgi:hypothetical protein